MDLYGSHPDEYLFSLLQHDDERAFTELYHRYWKKMLVKANLLLNSQEDAEELVHDIFVTLWRKRTQLQIHHTVQAYIGAMLQYGCFKVLASRRRRRLKQTDAEAPEMEDASTEQWLEFNALREELERAITRLPDQCQLVFRLSREQQLSDKEIAQHLHLSVHTVRTQMHRALQKLKTSLGVFFSL